MDQRAEQALADTPGLLLAAAFLLNPLCPDDLGALGLAAQDATELVERGLLTALAQGYAPAPDAAAAARQSYEILAAPARRLLLELAVARARGALEAKPSAEHETAYTQLVAQLCELLIQHEPAALAAVAAAALEALRTPAQRHLLAYYSGLGEGLAERYGPARSLLGALLAEPELDDAVRGRALNSAAIFARLQGDYEGALAGYQASAALWERLGNQARHGLALYNLGILHYDLHNYVLAGEGLRAAAALFAAAGDEHRLAMAHHELALVSRDQGRWDEALDYAGRAAARFAQEGLDDYLGRVANNIGEVELLRGRLDAALAQFERALALMTTRVYRVDVLLNQGLVHQARGDHAAATTAYAAALALAQAIERHEIVPALHGRLAHVARRRGDHVEAEVQTAAAIAAVEARREPMRDEGLLIGLMGRWQGLYEEAILAAAEEGDAARVLELGERARARAFADLLARRGGSSSVGQTPPLDLAAIKAALPQGALLLAYVATGLRGPEGALLEAMPPEAAPLRACLEVPPRLLLVAVDSTGIRCHSCPIDPNLLNAGSPFLADGRRFLRPAILRRLYDALIAPVADLVAAAEHVIVVPHGPLHQLPFAALLDPQGRPLLDRLPRLSYAPSATVLLGQAPAPPRPGRRPCLALGYGGEAAALRHTVAEARAVAEGCGGELWEGAPGVVERLRHEAASYSWLHLACHGQFRVDDALASWLEPGPGERLSAAEVIDGLALDADLVVLSACQSGVSRIARGDEPLGLVRAFMLAGARAVLVTLWSVEDHSARLLMERFYAGLVAQGADAPDALRAAQLALRDWRDADGARPFADASFWAAYALIGRAGAPYLA